MATHSRIAEARKTTFPFVHIQYDGILAAVHSAEVLANDSCTRDCRCSCDHRLRVESTLDSFLPDQQFARRETHACVRSCRS